MLIISQEQPNAAFHDTRFTEVANNWNDLQSSATTWFDREHTILS